MDDEESAPWPLQVTDSSLRFAKSRNDIGDKAEWGSGVKSLDLRFHDEIEVQFSRHAEQSEGHPVLSVNLSVVLDKAEVCIFPQGEILRLRLKNDIVNNVTLSRAKGLALPQ